MAQNPSQQALFSVCHELSNNAEGESDEDRDNEEDQSLIIGKLTLKAPTQIKSGDFIIHLSTNILKFYDKMYAFIKSTH